MLYANGCSFTAGTGLDDENKAWPYKLGELLGDSNVVSEATKGASNQYIVRSTISSLSGLIAEGQRPFVAIGLTAPSRREFYVSEKGLIVHNIPSPEYSENSELSAEENAELHYFNNVYLKYFWSPVYDFHLYLTHVLTLQNFFKVNGLEYVLFNSLNLTPNLVEETKFSELCDQANMSVVLSQIDMNHLYEQQTFFTHMYDTETYFNEAGIEGFMHPNETAHQEWAKIIHADILNTRGL